MKNREKLQVTVKETYGNIVTGGKLEISLREARAIYKQAIADGETPEEVQKAQETLCAWAKKVSEKIIFAGDDIASAKELMQDI
jgi:hypothetical protein